MWGNSQVGTIRDNSQIGEMWGNSKVGTIRDSAKVENDKRGQQQH
jgi:hypothetical protein